MGTLRFAHPTRLGGNIRALVVFLEAVGLATLGFGMFVLGDQYPEYAPAPLLFNLTIFLVALCLLLIKVQSVVWIDVKAIAIIGGVLFAFGLTIGVVMESQFISTLLLLQTSKRSGMVIAFSYAFLSFALLHCGLLLLKSWVGKVRRVGKA